MVDFEKLAGLAASANPSRPEDYRQDGLWYCGACRTPKQCRIEIGGKARVLPCQCACNERRYQAEKAAEKAREEQKRVETLRIGGIADTALRGCRFEGAKMTPLLEKCRNYAASWERVRRENIGLLLWGDTGGGKTYGAACIANAVIDKGVPVLITSFPRILAAGWDERGEFLRHAGRYPLMVLDDLGVERGTDMALETVYNVVDERYKSGKPLIVTTNLILDALKNPKDVAYKRIYQRVLEMCTPIQARPEAFRQNKAEAKRRAVLEILGEGGQK